MREPGDVLDTKELAALLRVSETTVRRMNLPGVEVGRGRWRYVRRQVLEELEKRAAKGGQMLRKVS